MNMNQFGPTESKMLRVKPRNLFEQALWVILMPTTALESPDKLVFNQLCKRQLLRKVTV